jgi:hypothetical protein
MLVLVLLLHRLHAAAAAHLQTTYAHLVDQQPVLVAMLLQPRGSAQPCGACSHN